MKRNLMMLAAIAVLALPLAAAKKPPVVTEAPANFACDGTSTSVTCTWDEVSTANNYSVDVDGLFSGEPCYSWDFDVNVLDTACVDHDFDLGTPDLCSVTIDLAGTCFDHDEDGGAVTPDVCFGSAEQVVLKVKGKYKKKGPAYTHNTPFSVPDTLLFVDADGDLSPDCLDCDDSDDSVYPDAPECSDDAVDSDCDGDLTDGEICEV